MRAAKEEHQEGRSGRPRTQSDQPEVEPNSGCLVNLTILVVRSRKYAPPTTEGMQAWPDQLWSLQSFSRSRLRAQKRSPPKRRGLERNRLGAQLPEAQLPGGPGAQSGAQPPRARSFVAACRPDFARFCSGVRPGGGRLRRCVKQLFYELSPRCHQFIQSRLRQ
jgi:hypothetical protein